MITEDNIRNMLIINKSRHRHKRHYINAIQGTSIVLAKTCANVMTNRAVTD
ncbi:MAG: hypothetical protein NC095_04215 [Muribaculum sp.]|nr:hypothetical protein [Muribaculum sp.]